MAVPKESMLILHKTVTKRNLALRKWTRQIVHKNSQRNHVQLKCSVRSNIYQKNCTKVSTAAKPGVAVCRGDAICLSGARMHTGTPPVSLGHGQSSDGACLCTIL